MIDKKIDKKHGQEWSDEDIEYAKKSLEFSESVKEAANNLGVTPDALGKAFKRRGLPSPSELLATEEEQTEEEFIEGSIKIHKWHKETKLSEIKHLVIPDAHVKPGVSNERFEWLGKFIVDIKPQVVVCIGDFADMESLCSYDKGKKSFEGRRYKKDIDASTDAQERMFHYINQEKKKDSGWDPRFILTYGNHSQARINKAIESTPEFEGLISVDDLKFKEFGWETFDFLDRVVVDEIAYSHYFPSGVMNKPIGGEYQAASIIKKGFMSCTQGHTHTRDFAERTRADGKKIMGLVCGCYFEHDEDYASVANSLWWRGIVVKNHVTNGQYEPQFVPIQKLRKEYSK